MEFGRSGLYILTVVSLLIFFSCRDDNNLEELRQQELQALAEYIETNNITIEPKPSGLYFIKINTSAGFNAVRKVMYVK